MSLFSLCCRGLTETVGSLEEGSGAEGLGCYAIIGKALCSRIPFCGVNDVTEENESHMECPSGMTRRERKSERL